MILAMEDFAKTIADAIKGVCDSIGLSTVGLRFIGLAAAASALVLLTFVIVALCSLASRSRKLTRKFKDASMVVSGMDVIDGDNVSMLNPYIQDMPSGVSSGWGSFLEAGGSYYPSDYMSADKTLGDKKNFSKNAPGKVAYSVLSLIFVLIGAYVGSCVSRAEGVLDVMSAGTIVYLLFDIISVIVFPAIIAIILHFALGAVYKSHTAKAYKAYEEFLRLLDDKVVIFKEPEEEETENLAKEDEKIDLLDDEVQKIINSKIEQNELIEIVTTPRVADVYSEEEVAAALPELDKNYSDPLDVSDVELSEDEVENIPLPTAAGLFEEEDYSKLPESLKDEPERPSKEESESKLQGLKEQVDAAVADMSVPKEVLLAMANMIKEAKSSGDYPDPKDAAVLDECLYKLYDLYYGV